MEKNTVETAEMSAAPASRPLTPAENVVLTLKILLGAGALVGILWYLDKYAK